MWVIGPAIIGDPSLAKRGGIHVPSKPEAFLALSEFKYLKTAFTQKRKRKTIRINTSFSINEFTKT
jgi:hypothetical protein